MKPSKVHIHLLWLRYLRSQAFEIVLLCLQIICMHIFREKALSCFLSPHIFRVISSFHPPTSFIQFLVGITAFCCTLIFPALLQLLQERMLTFDHPEPKTQYKHIIYTPPSPYWHSRPTTSLFYSLFLTKLSFACRVSKLNSLPWLLSPALK